ncbi:putative baseplate assembly protein [Kitasatospora sp. NPDC057541]|uniref:putative baseplate assembly protein n=1 Tax=unclassified Kitasatospora TaxID=2633591 RepID=UPI003691C849
MNGQCTCGCAGTATATPAPLFNPPGLDAIGYRVGRYGQFLDSLLARLSGPAYPALRDLTVRTPDDPAIALLDAWAVLADLLTFHSERIADEGYLRTATDEGSLTLLGRLVGHRPRPGVAAATHLAYTLDQDPRAAEDPVVIVPRGARSQSVPGPGEDPQSFETAEDLPARAAWNELAVLRRRPYQLTPGQLNPGGRAELFAAGTANNIRPGDRLLFVFSADKAADPVHRVLRLVPEVRLDRENDVTVIGLPRDLRTLKDLRAELADWITESETAPNPRPGPSRILRDFDAQVLAPLRADLDRPAGPLSTPAGYADRLAPVLVRTAEAAELARPRQPVADWFGRLGDELSALCDRAHQLEPPQVPEGTGPHPGGPAAGDPAVRGLGPLLAALRTAPPRPPLSARDLARDPRRLFAPGSDLGAQLLAALDPRLRDGLYPAWRRVDLTVPPAVHEIQAMRVVATPFGATAPLKPVYGADGRIDRYVDWPLSGSTLIGVRVTFDAAGAVPRTADFTYVEAGSLLHSGFSLPWDHTFPFGPGQVEVVTTEPPTPPPNPPSPPNPPNPPSPTNPHASAVPSSDPEPGVSARFLPGLPERRVSVSRPQADDRVHVTIDGGPGPALDYRLDPGQEKTGESGELNVRVHRYPATEQSPPAVEVVFTTKLQPVSGTVLTLDAVYDQIAPGSWVVIQRPRKGLDGGIPGSRDLAEVITRVTDVRVISRADFGITGKVTELSLQQQWLDDQDTQLSHIRDATVYARGESLRLADEPVTEDVHGDRIELARLHDGLTPGRWIVVEGERTDIPHTTGVRASELAMIAGVEQGVDPRLPGDTVRTTITLSADLAHRYRRDTVRILGNVVRATQGATRDEAIGSGDAGVPGQRFALWQSPLTWLAADTPGGARSTLEVRVDGVRWHEVDSLAGRGPDERVYVTATATDGRTTVTFGDGVHGSRLPTGRENVRARYRIGIGAPGNVGAGRITQLTTRPLGVSAVVNPLPATGGADPDGPGLARRTVPLAVTSLDRLVSVPDYEDFTRSRAGIGRAAATRLSDGRRELVHVTVAGVDDIPLTDGSDPVRTLRSALTAYGDPRLPVEVAPRELVLLVVALSVGLDPDHSWDVVEPALRRALLDRLGYAGRQLGQSAHLSEVLATAQAVPGVDRADVDAFTGVPGSLTPEGLEQLPEQLARPWPTVPARLARFEERRYRVRDPAGESLTDVAARHGIPLAELLRLNPGITDTRPLPAGRVLTVFRGIRPAQLALLSADLPDTLILKEVHT